MATAPNQSNNNENHQPSYLNKYTIGAVAVVATVAAAAYTLTRPTKPKKPRRPRPANQPRTRKYDKTFQRKILDIHLTMRDLSNGLHAHVAADKKNTKAGLVVGSSLVKINGEKVENESFETIYRKLQQAKAPVKLTFRENPELQEQWERANDLKEKANAQYTKEKNTEAALVQLSEAIQLHPTNKVYYSNRVLMLLKTQDYDAALNDCQTMRELDPLSLYVKGHYVRGLVLMNLEKYKHARSAFQTVLKLNSDFSQARGRLQECLQKLEQLELDEQKDGEEQRAVEENQPVEAVEVVAAVEPVVQPNEAPVQEAVVANEPPVEPAAVEPVVEAQLEQPAQPEPQGADGPAEPQQPVVAE